MPPFIEWHHEAVGNPVQNPSEDPGYVWQYQPTYAMENVFMIGKKLKQLRDEHKYTQVGVAIELGVAPSTYSDYERGVVNVPGVVVVRAATSHKKDLSYFYSPRGPVSITMNDQASNGYVEQQHAISVEFFERLLRKNDERWEALTKRMMTIVERAIRKAP